MAKLIRNFNNHPQHAVFDGVEYRFRSKLEYRWAMYLDFLKKSGEIQEWDFESTQCIFGSETCGPMQWLIDFTVINKDGEEEYYECKGWPESRDVSKARRFKARWPESKLYFVFAQKISKRHFQKERSLKKYVDRIIIAGPIFRQLGIK